MKYDDPQLREALASRYVLGTMPRLARARFDRLIAEDAVFCAEVRDWAEMFAPVDAAERPVAPPPRVWRAIEAALGPAALAPGPARAGWWRSLTLWRSAAGLATAVAVALLIYVAVVGLHPAPPLPTVVAVLMDKDGAPAWIARTESREFVNIAALRRQTIDSRHSYELWAIAGGAPPKPLGLLAPGLPGGQAFDASAVPPTGGVLAISLEPAGGSPTGKPTGPVLFQGKVFSSPL
jgi:anti-sigma-K factor RskA